MTYRTFDGTSQTETIVDGRFSSSGDIALSDGSVTQGAIYFADDKNTGIYSPSNDSIAFSTAGSAALTIASDNAATFTGNVNVEGLTKSLKIGDIAGDNYVQIQQVSGSTARGFTVQHGQASVLENLQGATNQHLVLGDVDANSANTLFGISHTTGGGSTVERFNLTGAGNATFAGNVTLGGGTSPSLTINASTHDASTANEAKVEFRYNQSHANDSIGYIKLVEGGTNSYSGYLSFGVPYLLNGDTPATHDDVLKLDHDKSATFAGKVNIAGGTTKADLHIKAHTNSWEGGILLEDSGGNDGWNIHPETDGSLKFGYNDDITQTLVNQSAAAKINFKSNGNLEIYDGDLEVASGHGIDFSSTSDATGKTSELLDDYEEGTWTPTWNTASATATFSYDTNGQKGSYTKIGNIVHFEVYLKLASSNGIIGGSGALYIGGLPFDSNASKANGGLSIAYTNAWQNTAPSHGLVSESDNICYVYAGTNSSGTSDVGGAGNFANSTEFRAYGSYMV